MIVILKPNVSEARRDQLISWFKAQNLGVHISQGDYQTVLGLIGDTKSVDMDLIASLDIVDAVRRVSDPFKCCNRKFHPDDTIVDVSGVKIGGGNFAMIAGPCSVESEEQIVGVANDVKKAGAKLLRGGAFKPRTSPYDFQGLKAEGLRHLSVAKKETALPIVTEIMDVRHLRSEMGVIYLCSFNEAVIKKTLRESNLVFSELFSARPHIFIGRNNPLAGRERVNMKDLESLPCLTYEQGDQNSFYFSEEILSTLNHEKSIKVTDKGTIIDLMTGTDGYTISSGICPSYLRGDDIISIPLDVEEIIRIGVITHKDYRPTALGQMYLDVLHRVVGDMQSE